MNINMALLEVKWQISDCCVFYVKERHSETSAISTLDVEILNA